MKTMSVPFAPAHIGKRIGLAVGGGQTEIGRLPAEIADGWSGCHGDLLRAASVGGVEILFGGEREEFDRLEAPAARRDSPHATSHAVKPTRRASLIEAALAAITLHQTRLQREPLEREAEERAADLGAKPHRPHGGMDAPADLGALLASAR